MSQSLSVGRMSSTSSADYTVLIDVFASLFADTEGTLLVAGSDEPFYRSARSPQDYHQVIFAHGFFNSALHEVAHWCIAGRQRRQQDDYGYWYAPDGRTPEQQRQFEQVEVRPQALEQCFTWACGRSFIVSVDNLNGEPGSTWSFERAVHKLTLRMLDNVALMPPRGYLFFKALCERYHRPLTTWHEAIEQAIQARLTFLQQVSEDHSVFEEA